MAKFISIDEAVKLIPDGATLMIGGFLGCGCPHKLIDALAKAGTKDLTVIANDASMLTAPDGSELYATAKLVKNRQIKKLIASHVGTNPLVAEQVNEGAIELTLVPQGSLAEMIRAAGAGLGGVLTPTGLGTIVAEGKQTVEVDGVEYLLEKPLRADFALLSGYKVDKLGNIWYKGTTRNFNLPMATAADTVIVEADNVVEIGDIEPENVMTSRIFVDYIIDGGKA